MSSDLEFDGFKYISAKRARELTGYSTDYIGQLARAQKIPARLVGRSWYVNEIELIKHQSENAKGQIRETRLKETISKVSKTESLEKSNNSISAAFGNNEIKKINNLTVSENSSEKESAVPAVPVNVENINTTIFTYSTENFNLIPTPIKNIPTAIDTSDSVSDFNKVSVTQNVFAPKTSEEVETVTNKDVELNKKISRSYSNIFNGLFEKGIAMVLAILFVLSSALATNEKVATSFYINISKIGSNLSNGNLSIGDFVFAFESVNDEDKVRYLASSFESSESIFSKIGIGISKVGNVAKNVATNISSKFSGLFGAKEIAIDNTIDPVIETTITNNTEEIDSSVEVNEVKTDNSTVAAETIKTKIEPVEEPEVTKKESPKEVVYVTGPKEIVRYVSGDITSADVDAKLLSLANALKSEIYKYSSSITGQYVAPPSIYQVASLAHQINKLPSGVDISNPVISGGSISGTSVSGTLSGSFTGSISSSTLSGTTTATSGIDLSGGCFAVNGVCISSGGGITGSGVNGQLALFSGAGTLNSTSNITYDNVNGRLGIGTTSPYNVLSVYGTTTSSTFEATSTATSTFAGGLQVGGLSVVGSATSTFANGLNISGGCYAINGTCFSGGGSGTPGGANTQIQFNDAGSFGADSSFTFNKNTGLLSVTSALFTYASTTNFLATGSSTLQNFTALQSTTTNSTSTNFFSTTASSTNLFSSSLNTGNITGGLATLANLLSYGSSTLQDFTFVNGTGSSATTTNFYSANLSTSNLSISSLLTVANLLATGSSTLQNFTGINSTTTNSTSTTLFATTLSGTNAYITSLLSASNLLISGSSTLQNFTFINATGTNATTTNFFATTASSTNLYAASSSLGTLTVLNTSTTTFGGGLAISGDGLQVLSSASSSFIGGVRISGGLALTASNCTLLNNGGKLTTDSNGNVVCANDVSGSGGGGSEINWSYSPNPSDVTYGLTYLATTTNQVLIGASATTSLAKLEINSPNSFLVTGSSTLQNFTFVNGTGTSATTTNFFSTTASSTNLFTTNATSSILAITGTASTSALYLGVGGGTTGCLQVAANGLVSNTGTACGSGSGSVVTMFSTSTSAAFPNAIYVNGGNNTLVGIGTTTPAYMLQIASSTGAQLALSDPSSLTNNHWTFRNAGGNLYISTSSSSTLATSTMPAITVNTNGFVGINNSNPAYSLDITGNSRVFGTSTVTNSLQVGTIISPSYTFEVQGTALIKNNQTPSGFKGMFLANDSYSQLRVSTTTNAISTASEMLIGTNGTEGYGWIQSNGTVSLGSWLCGTSGGCSSYAQGGWLGTLSNSDLHFFTNSQNASVTLKTGGNLGVGTTTPNWTLQVASATPAFAITDSNAGTNAKHWLFSNVDGTLYIGTSSDALTATSSYISINGSTTAFTNNINVTGNGTSTFTNGLNIYGGCYAINGSCLPTSSASASGVSGQVAFFNGGSSLTGTNNFYYDTNKGTLGIGTSTPNWNLQLASSTAPQLVLTDPSATTNQKHWYFRTVGGNLYLGTSTDALNATSTLLSITASGKIGFGTDSPDLNSKFEIENSEDTSNALLRLHNPSSGSNSTSRLEVMGSSYAVSLGMTSSNYSGSGVMSANTGHLLSVGTGGLALITSEANAPIKFSTGGLYDEVARFSSKGNFGLGTTTPNWTIQIASATPSLAITDSNAGTNNKHWLFSNVDGTLYIGTSSDDLTATSSQLSISTTGTTTVKGLNVTGVASSTFSNGITLSSGCFAIGTSCIGAGSSAGGGTGAVQFANGSNLAGDNSFFYDDAFNTLGVGTSTPNWKVQIATSTAPQLALTDPDGPTNGKHWVMRSAGGNLYIGTSSDALSATSTYATFNNLGYFGIGTTSPFAQLSIQGNAGNGGNAPLALAVYGGTGASSGNGGGIRLQTGNGGTSAAGGAFTVLAGDGNGAASGGAVSITGGIGGASGAGGQVTITSGAPGGNGNSGAVTLASGATGGSGTSGTVTIQGGNNTPQTGTGGTVTLSSGASLGSGATLSLTGGNAAGTGGAISVSAGAGASGGAGGALTISGGTASTDNNGGAITITPGAGNGAGSGGQLNLNGGSGGATNVNGSDVRINGGTAGGSAKPGNVILANSRGVVGIGTTTPNWSLQVASATPYIALTDTNAGTNVKHWLFSNVDGTLYIGTSSDALTSTSTRLTIANSGAFTFNSSATSTFNSGLTITGNLNIATSTNATSYIYWGGKQFITATTSNTYLGLSTASSSLVSAVRNTGVGFEVLQALTSGTDNTAIGERAMHSLTTGTQNTAIGQLSLGANVSGTRNTAGGYQSLRANTVNDNTAFGSSALALNSTGYSNTAIGSSALQQSGVGGGGGSSYNTAIGYQSLVQLDTGGTGGGANVAVGAYALGNSNLAASSTAIGTWAGLTNTSGVQLTLIGAESDVLVDGLTNAGAIGYKSLVGRSNSFVIGSTTQIQVGIGTTTPNWLLQISSTTPSLAITDLNAGTNAKHWLFSNVDGVFSIGTSSDALNSTSTRFLIDRGGNVGIGTTSPYAPLSVNGVTTNRSISLIPESQEIRFTSSLNNIIIGKNNSNTGSGTIVGDTNTNISNTSSIFGRGNTDSSTGMNFASIYGQFNTLRGDTGAPLIYGNSNIVDVTSQYGVAVGYQNLVTSARGIAFGASSTASAEYSSAFGYNSLVSGVRSSAFGASTTVSSDYSTAIGHLNYVTGIGSSAFGSFLTNSLASTTMVGPTDASKLTISANGGSGFGTTTPLWSLQVASGTPSIAISDTNAILDAKHWLLTNVDGTLRIGTSSDALDATSSPFAFFGDKQSFIVGANNTPIGLGGGKFQIYDDEETGGTGAAIRLYSAFDNTGGPVIRGLHQRGVFGTPTILTSGDELLSVQGWGYDGASYRNTARILFVTDGTINSGTALPTSITFSTSPTGTAGLTERMKISPIGNVGVGTSTPFWTFQVASITPYVAITDSDAGTNFKHWLLSNNDGIFRIGTSSDALNATGTALTINTNGFVGIGSTSPSVPLSILGNTYSSGSGRFEGGLSVGASAVNTSGLVTNLSSAAASAILSGASTTLTVSGGLGYAVGSVANVNVTSTAVTGIGYRGNIYVSSTNGSGQGEKITVSAANSGSSQFLYGSDIAVVPDSTGDTAYGILLQNTSVGTINDPTVDQIGLYLGWSIPGTDANSKKYGLYAPATSNNSNKFFIGDSLGIGTTTPNWTLQVASATPALAITDSTAGTNAKHWLMSNTDGVFYIGTSSDALNATSTYLTLTGSSTTFATGNINVTGNGTSTFTNGIQISSGCFSVNGTCIPTDSLSGSGSTGQVAFFNGASSLTGNNNFFYDTNKGTLGVGTTTPNWNLQLASSTAPQLALSDGTLTSSHWTMRSVGGNFYIATASPGTLATSSRSVFSINNNGYVGISSTTPSSALSITGTTTGDVFNSISNFGIDSYQVNEVTVASASTTLSNFFMAGATGASRLLGTYNYAFGIGAMANATNSAMTSNIAIGRNALAGSPTAQNTGAYNVAVGSFGENYSGALYSNTTGSKNSAFGAGALASNESGDRNIAIGFEALSLSATSSDNVAIGDRALASFNYNRGYNTAVGSQALLLNRAGYYNTGIGGSALANNQSGYSNTGIGLSVLSANNSGASSTAIGAYAGKTNTTGSQLTLLGADTDVLINNLTNAGAIGYKALVGRSNSLVLGSTTQIQVGVGTTTPNWLLQISSTTPAFAITDSNAGTNAKHWLISNTDGVFSIGTSSDALNSTSTRFLIDRGGNVGIGTTTPYAPLSVTSSNGNSAYFAGRVGVGTSSPSALGALGPFDLTVQTASSGAGGVLITNETSGSTAFASLLLKNNAGSYGGVVVPSSTFNSSLGIANRTVLYGANNGLTLLTENTTDDIRFSIGYTEMARLSSGGNLGVGTTTPQWSFQVASNTPALAITDSNAGTNAKHWLISNNDGIFRIGTSSDALTSTSTVLTINNAGSVGIGTTSPSARLSVSSTSGISAYFDGNVGIGTNNPTSALHLKSSSQLSPYLKIESTNSGTFGLSGVKLINDLGEDNAGGTLVSYSSGYTNANLQNDVSLTAVYDLHFWTADTERVTVTSIGNVGIGSSTPFWALQVASNTPTIAITDSNGGTNAKHWLISNTDGVFTIGTSSDDLSATSTLITINSAGTASTTNLILGGAGGGTAGCAQFDATGLLSNTGAACGASSASPLTMFSTSTSSAFPNAIYVNGSNNTLVGIGTSTPAYMLQIASSTGAQLALSDPTGPTDGKHWIMRSAGGNLYIGTSSDTNLSNTGTTTVFTISNGGKVGIGTTSPASALSVSGNAYIVSDDSNPAASIWALDIGGTDNSDPSIRVKGNSSRNAYFWLDRGSISDAGDFALATAGVQNWFIGQERNNNNGTFAIRTAADANDYTGTSRLTITAGGNVGIGTSTANWTAQVASATPTLAITDSNAGTNAKHWLLSAVDGIFNIGTSSDALNATSTYLTISHSTTSIYKSLDVGSGSIVYDASSTETYISNLVTGNQTFDDDAGAVQWANLPITNAAYGTWQSYSGLVDDVPVLTVYGVSNGGGDVNNTGVSIGTTTPSYSRLTVWGRGTGASTTLDVVNNASTSLMRILDSGRIGIGSSTPAWLMQLSTSTVPQLALTDASLTSNQWTFRNAGSFLYIATASPSTYATSTVPAVTINNNGLLGIATTTPWRTLSVTGSVAFDGLSAIGSSGEALCLTAGKEVGVNTASQTCTVSSIKYKDNVQSLGSGLELVRQLNPVTYTSKATGESRLGFIAEEVFEVEPRLVFMEADGASPRGVRYEEVTPVLAKAIQELDARLLALESASTTGTGTSTIFNTESIKSSLASFGVFVSDAITHITNLAVDRLTVGSSSNPTGITMFDEVSKSPYCVTINNGILKSTSGECLTESNNSSSVFIAPEVQNEESTTTSAVTTSATTTTSSTEQIIDNSVSSTTTESQNEVQEVQIELPSEETVLIDGEIPTSTEQSVQE